MPRGERDKGRGGEKGRERIWPGETLQHECTGAIKNITRDECNSVYLAAEKEAAMLCFVRVCVFCVCVCACVFVCVCYAGCS